MDVKQESVLIGNNTFMLNEATMLKLLTDWLNVNISGGPYEAVSCKYDSGNVSYAVKVLAKPTMEKTK